MMFQNQSQNQNFNPRLREGGDPLCYYIGVNNRISIHASEKEATVTLRHQFLQILISIHASEKEATLSKAFAGMSDEISIHASEKEATLFVL